MKKLGLTNLSSKRKAEGTMDSLKTSPENHKYKNKKQ